jgi:hypothetical protein
MCVWERESEREKECVCMCVRAGGSERAREICKFIIRQEKIDSSKWTTHERRHSICIPLCSIHDRTSRLSDNSQQQYAKDNDQM